MARRIHEDHKDFRDVISGRTRRELKRLIKNGSIVTHRPKGGRMTISVPQIEIPRFLFGDNGEGVGRGEGEKGKVISKDPAKGKGGGTEHADGITVSIDMEDVLKFLQDDLELPDMKPKPSKTYEDVKLIYNNISRVGPESLRHTRRTLLETMRRQAMLQDPDSDPFLRPDPEFIPTSGDKRYRQYREVHIPSSNAVIFFARDCSGSMDDYRCEIVNDMCWWINCWIKRFYEKLDRVFILHDTEAEECDEKKFFEYRAGGGTMASSAFKHIAQMLETRYPPHAYNVYIFYFTDGDNWEDDNPLVLEALKTSVSHREINLIGITQVCPTGNGLKEVIENAVKGHLIPGDHIRTVKVGKGDEYGPTSMTPEDRNQQILGGIKALLGKERKFAPEAA